MRSSIALALLSIPVFVTAADAGPLGGGGGGKGGSGGGGALGRVSAGIGSASRGSSPSSSGSSSSGYRDDSRYRDTTERQCYDGDGEIIDCPFAAVAGSGTALGMQRRGTHVVAPSKRVPRVDFYAGAQKVADSDGAGTIALSVTEERFRIAASFTRYYERLGGGGVLTMSMPTLTGGLRIDDMGPTSVFLEGGVVHARTNGDPMGDAQITGPIAGLRVEHALSSQISLVGDVQQMWFPHEIRATAGGVGVRYRYVQASFRALDFNVGPPLYGPEVGVRF